MVFCKLTTCVAGVKGVWKAEELTGLKAWKGCDVLAAGVSCWNVLAAGVSCWDVLAAGVSCWDVLAAGVSCWDVLAAGISCWKGVS